jgi:CheY-like chemotaxis protein
MAMHTGRILIAGGDRLDALDLQQRLARMGHLVLAIARSSDEALQLAGVLRPDAVVMDARLPGLMDSIQAGTHIWAHPRGAPPAPVAGVSSGVALETHGSPQPPPGAGGDVGTPRTVARRPHDPGEFATPTISPS